MLLILTSSNDPLVDQLLPCLDGEPFFRFNIDDWRNYTWRFTSESYSLTSPYGETCLEKEIKTVWLRPWQFLPKSYPLSLDGSLDSWCCREVEQVIAGICDLAMHEGKLLTGMKRFIAWSPIYQLRMAARHFSVPMWEILKGEKPHLRGEILAKAQTKTFLTQGLPASPRLCDLEERPLNLDYPWLLQEYLVGITHTIMVSYVDGTFFAYQQEKVQADVSPKEGTVTPTTPYRLTDDQQTSMEALIKDLDISIAQFNFTLQPGNKLSCLSIQPFLPSFLHLETRLSLINKIKATLNLN